MNKVDEMMNEYNEIKLEWVKKHNLDNCIN